MEQQVRQATMIRENMFLMPEVAIFTEIVAKRQEGGQLVEALKQAIT